MIIPVIKDKGAIRINSEYAGAVPEFAAVLDDEKLGAPYLAFVIYMTDPAEDNIYATLPEDIRKKKICDAYELSSELLKDGKIKAALKEYKEFCKHNVSYQFKADYVEGMQKVSGYIKNTKTLTDENAKKFSDVLSDMPKLLKGKEEIEKISTKDLKKPGRTKGDKVLTFAEKRNLTVN